VKLAGQGWYRFHPRLFDHPGPVIDIGCLGWDWSQQFAGKKRIVGYDPLETSRPNWAELVQAAVSISDGTATLSGDGVCASLIAPSGGARTIATVSLTRVLRDHPDPSIMKLNIEGAEYPLLWSRPHPWTDQLVVSFHLYEPMQEAIKATITYLSQWYEHERINEEFNWVLFLRRG
jgi:hypothetical protein